jgi:hypothetical protein
VDARDFFYSRISMAIGSDVLVQIFDQNGIWQHCNDAAADYLQQSPDWFIGRCLFDEMPTLLPDWRDVLQSVCLTRETYLDRTRRGLLDTPAPRSSTSPGASSPSPSPFTTTAAAQSSPPASLVDPKPTPPTCSPSTSSILFVIPAFACPFICHSRREPAFAFAVACPFASRPTKSLRLLSPLQGFNS